MTGLRHLIEYLLFRGVACVVDCLTPRATAALARTLAWGVLHLLPAKVSRTNVAAENLRLAYGDSLTPVEVRQIIERMWVHLFRLAAEVIQAPRRLHLHSYRRVIEFHNLELSNEPLLSGRQLVLLGGHFGNWEVAISMFGMWGFPLGVVARTLDNPLMNAWFREYREQTGHRMLAKKGDYDDMLELLGRGGSVALLCDQDAGSRGLFVDFFGTPASTFKSIALLALEYDAVLVAGASVRLPDDFERQPWVKYAFGCYGVFDPRDYTDADAVRQLTQDYTNALERAIRAAPEQYFWVHRRWKSEPRRKRSAA